MAKLKRIVTLEFEIDEIDDYQFKRSFQRDSLSAFVDWFWGDVVSKTMKEEASDESSGAVAERGDAGE